MRSRKAFPKDLQKLENSTVPFCSRAELAKRSNLRAAGGIRCWNFASIKDEYVKLKFFALLIAFQLICSCGGRNHLKTAIALLVNKQSATFLLRKKSGFSSPPPSEISTQWKFVICRGTRQIFSHLAGALQKIQNYKQGLSTNK